MSKKSVLEPFFKLAVDSRKKGQLFYWKAGTGYRRLTSDQARSLMASGQQLAWHDLMEGATMGNYYINQYEDISDRTPDRHQLVGDFGGGIQKMVVDNEDFNIILRGESLVELKLAGNLKETNYLKNELGGEVRWIFDRNGDGRKGILMLYASGASIHHSEGTEFKTSWGYKYERNTWGVFGTSDYFFGKRQNYVKYNLDNEPYFWFGIIVKLRLKKR